MYRLCFSLLFSVIITWVKGRVDGWMYMKWFTATGSCKLGLIGLLFGVAGIRCREFQVVVWSYRDGAGRPWQPVKHYDVTITAVTPPWKLELCSSRQNLETGIISKEKQCAFRTSVVEALAQVFFITMLLKISTTYSKLTGFF